MKPKFCQVCGHFIERHSHLGTHECKVDGCLCLAYLSRISIHSSTEGSAE